MQREGRLAKHFGSFEKLRQVCPDNMVHGKKEDEGYGYLPDIDISVQGQESNAACHSVIELARSLRIELDTSVIWRPKDKTTFPGERSPLTIRSQQTQDAIAAVAETVAS